MGIGKSTYRIAAVAALLFLCCGCKKEKPPLEEALTLLETDPKAAVPRFEALHKQDPAAFEPAFYLGVAHFESGNPAGAIEVLERARQTPAGKENEVALKDRLYVAYLALAEKRGDEARTQDALEKAAALEADLRIRNIKANKLLFERRQKAFEEAKQASDFDRAIAEAEAVQGLYWDADARRAMKKEIPELRRKKFDKAFDDAVTGLEKEWVEKGMFDAPARVVALSGEFVVPPKDEEGNWDETQPGFDDAAQREACLPLFRTLGGNINQLAKASPLGRELEERHLNYFGNEALKTMKKGWKTPHEAGAVRAADTGEGQPEQWTYTCQLHLPLTVVREQLYVLYKHDQKEKEKGAGDTGERAEGRAEEAPGAEPAEAPAGEPAQAPAEQEGGAPQGAAGAPAAEPAPSE